MKNSVGKVYFKKYDGKLPVFFKVKESTKNKKLNDYLLLVDRFELTSDGVQFKDTYNLWYKHDLVEESFIVLNESHINKIKSKYNVKKGLNKLR